MFILRICPVIGFLSLSMLATGCFSTKNKEVVDAPAPPPAAYPDTSANLAGGSAVPTMPSPSGATMAATNQSASAPAPAPFSLREGEQLVNHQIQQGESLSSIAAKYNSSVSRIQSANGISGTKIIAGKSIQVPTSAPPANLASSGSAMAPAPSASPYPAPSYQAPSASPYPGTTAPAPAIAPATAPNAPGAIAAPPVPSTGSAGFPGYPSTTSIPRTQGVPTAAGAYPTPSFEASRIQFSN